MGKSVLLSKDSIRFKNTNGVVTTTLTVNNDGNIDISGRLIGDISGDNISTPMASSSVLGGVKINGNNLSIDGNGVLSVSGNLSQWTTSSNDIYYTTGNVGIGTISPNQKLVVIGDSSFNGNLYISDAAATTSPALTINATDGQNSVVIRNSKSIQNNLYTLTGTKGAGGGGCGGGDGWSMSLCQAASSY